MNTHIPLYISFSHYVRYVEKMCRGEARTSDNTRTSDSSQNGARVPSSLRVTLPLEMDKETWRKNANVQNYFVKKEGINSKNPPTYEDVQQDDGLPSYASLMKKF